MDQLLTHIKLSFPTRTFADPHLFLSLFRRFAKIDSGTATFVLQPAGYSPQVLLEFEATREVPVAIFSNSDGSEIEIPLANHTGTTWPSPHSYQLLSLDEVTSRLQSNDIHLESCDHLGINLTSKTGFNPLLSTIIDFSSRSSLLHAFPGNQDWFFILPGSSEEIRGKQATNYALERKPKFELVNFTKTSTPLIQIDVATDADFTNAAALFPEAIIDYSLKNLWVYLHNATKLDICLVLNEQSNGWTNFFQNQRIQ